MLGHYSRKKKNVNSRGIRELNEFYNCSDSDLQRLYPILPIVNDLPLQIIKHINVILGIVNGTDGHIVGANFPVGTEFKKINIDNLNCYIASKLTPVVHVNIEENHLFYWSWSKMDFQETVFLITPFKHQVNVKLLYKTFYVTTEQIRLSISRAAAVY